MNILKTLRNTLSIATLLALMSFRVNEPTTNIFGEWSNLREDKLVKCTFFPTGMVHVMVGNYIRTYKYKIHKPGKNNEITGQMYLTNGIMLIEGSNPTARAHKGSRNAGYSKNTIPFTASIKDGKEMSLRLGKDPSTMALSLIKTREFGSDMMFVK